MRKSTTTISKIAENKEDKVKLVMVSDASIEQTLDFSHAEKLLAFEASYGINEWKLADSKYTFKDGKLITSSSTPGNQGAASQKGADKSGI